MQAIEKLFFALLQSEVCGVPLPRALPSLSDADLRTLFRLADRQDLAHLLYDALVRNALLEEGDPAYKSFSKAQLLAVYRTEELTREHRRLEAVNAVRQKFGKNAMLRAMDLLPDATARERNRQIGGHRSGT